MSRPRARHGLSHRKKSRERCGRPGVKAACGLPYDEAQARTTALEFEDGQKLMAEFLADD